MGIQPRSPAISSVGERDDRPATPIGGCGCWSGLMCALEAGLTSVGDGRLPDTCPRRTSPAPGSTGSMISPSPPGSSAGSRRSCRRRRTSPSRWAGPLAAMPKLRRPPEMWSIIATRLASSAGWWYGSRKPPGPIRRFFGLARPLDHQQVRRGVGLPHRGVVLADPGLLEAVLVGPPQVLQVPVVAVRQAALRRMAGHREKSDLHGLSSRCSFFQNASVARKREHSTRRVWLRYDETDGQRLARRSGAAFPSPPCGRRWRAAPDEGFSPTSRTRGNILLIRLAAASSFIAMCKASDPFPRSGRLMPAYATFSHKWEKGTSERRRATSSRTWSRRTAPSASRAASASIAAGRTPRRRVRPPHASPSAGRRAWRARARPCRPCRRRRSPRPASAR